MKKEFLTGNESIVRAALASGAQMMSGYPITPTTEIIHYWSEAASKNASLKFIQTEDEMSAGFAMIGAILAGTKAFTATAGPGNILMQDALSMAENMRIPTVAFINQRGGPSTGTVIYSQQELNLTCFGGNGEGLRIVYSAATPQDLYDYTIKVFNTAWRYRFPTFMLADGYQAKTQAQIETYEPQEKQIEIISTAPYLNLNGEPVNLRNTYNLEKEINKVIESHRAAFSAAAPEIVEFDDYHTLDADLVIFAHGIVAAACKNAVDALRQNGFKVGLFRPITLNPFPKEAALRIMPNKKAILVTESSLGQFLNLIKVNLYGQTVPIHTYLRPALGISVEEIYTEAEKILKEING